jgi:hypothetical protein
MECSGWTLGLIRILCDIADNAIAINEDIKIHIGRKGLIVMVLTIGLGPITCSAGLAFPDKEFVFLQPRPEFSIVMIN